LALDKKNDIKQNNFEQLYIGNDIQQRQQRTLFLLRYRLNLRVETDRLKSTGDICNDSMNRFSPAEAPNQAFRLIGSLCRTCKSEMEKPANWTSTPRLPATQTDKHRVFLFFFAGFRFNGARISKIKNLQNKQPQPRPKRGFFCGFPLRRSRFYLPLRRRNTRMLFAAA